MSTGSDDRRIIVWDCERGLPLSSILLHVPILRLAMSSDASRVAIHLYESQRLPIICLHNTPAAYVKVPVYVAPAIEGEYWVPGTAGRGENKRLSPPLRRFSIRHDAIQTRTISIAVHALSLYERG